MDTRVAELLGGERVLGASVKSNLDLARAIRQGLPAETAVQLADLILNFKPLQGAVKEVLNRLRVGNGEERTPPARLTPEQSDAVVRTARTLAKAIDVLGEKKKGSALAHYA
jgi:uncharacterized protein (DUF2384 family)